MSGVRKKKQVLDQLLKDEIASIVLDLICRGESLTMDEIAHHCGVSKGTLYNYFENKEDLFEQVHEIVIAPILESNRLIFESDHDPLSKLHEFIDFIFCIHDNKISRYFSFIRQKDTAEKIIKERVRAIVLPLSKLCREGIAAGVFVDVNPYILAEMIYGAAVGSFASDEFRSPDKDLQKIKQDVFTLINRVVCNKQEQL